MNRKAVSEIMPALHWISMFVLHGTFKQQPNTPELYRLPKELERQVLQV